MFERFPDLMKAFISDYNNGNRREICQYCNGSCGVKSKMWKCLPIVCFVGLAVLASPTRNENSVEPIHIIKPPVRCPEGMKPDANGRCREIWGRSIDVCPEGEEPDDDGLCREAVKVPECDGVECTGEKNLVKRDVEEQTETIKPIKKQRRMEALKSEKKAKKRFYSDDAKAKQARSKHAFLMMIKKKKMQMMKPKPPPPPPHHPPHHHPPHEGAPEEEPEEEATEAPPPEEPEPARLFFANEICAETENSTGGCRPDVEVVEKVDENKEFKEWKPEKSSESSDSSSKSSSSSSSDSTGESESEAGSGESEDEVLEKAIKIKLMKLFRMKERYGPALRRWLVAQLREYEDRWVEGPKKPIKRLGE